jgi:AAA-ATPase Vps4-associated protein 1
MKNQYILRATASERPCFVCSKFSSVVLTSADNSNEDWFYVCKSHLNDANFCSRNGGSSPRPISPASPKPPVAKNVDVKPESNSVSDLLSGIGTGIWNTWKGNTKSDDEPAKGKEEDSKKTTSALSNSPTPPPAASTPPLKPSPVTYILHRDFYYLREREVQKRKAKKDAAARLHTMQFPEVPKTMPGSLAKPN